MRKGCIQVDKDVLFTNGKLSVRPIVYSKIIYKSRQRIKGSN